MLKRLIVGALLGAAGFTAFAPAPAMAGDDPQVVQIIGIQTCRSVDIAGIGAAIHNILGITHEEGDCINGSSIDNSNGHANHNGSGNDFGKGSDKGGYDKGH
ncbi:hypothetical protein [Actinomadura fibrosa]|uniref:DUF320 domain-containing protein n=1 Tax=Actinomadura fibrosa TaxID=111802 RepID=A0ABW2XFJ6_9ACTN|nr:hypothetical protein [Actinomadura fibrosa]